jgi:RNA polymerase sigma factor (sigma-70 family)
VTHDGFATTRWSIVNAAAHGSDGRTAEALAELCQIYWPPLYGYLRRRGHGPEDAQDLTQGFFARFLERQIVRSADPARGKFRAFLLTAFKRYVINEHERAIAVRRGGRHMHLALNFEDAERAYTREQHADDTPEQLFDRKWASITLGRALERLRGEYDRAGKQAEADILLPYLTESSQLPSYKDAGITLGMSEDAVKVAVHRLRRRFGESLRLEVAETVRQPDEIEDEMRELMRAVSK